MRTIGEWCLNNEQQLDEELKAICYYRILEGYDTDDDTTSIPEDLRRRLYLLAVKGNNLCSRLFHDPNDSDRYVFLPYCAKLSLSTDPSAFDAWTDSLVRQAIDIIGYHSIKDCDKILFQRIHSAMQKGYYEHAETILDSLTKYEHFNQSTIISGQSSLSGIMAQRPLQYGSGNGSLSSWAVKLLIKVLSGDNPNYKTRIPLERARLSWLRGDNKWSEWLNIMFKTFVNETLPSNDDLLMAQFAVPDYYASYENLIDASAQYNNSDVRSVYNAALFLKGSTDQLIPHVYRWIKQRSSLPLLQSLDTLRQYGVLAHEDWEEFEVTYSPEIMDDIKTIFPSYDDIAALLDTDECAVEIVRVESLDLSPRVKYNALLLRQNSYPILVELFDEQVFKDALSRGRAYDSDRLFNLIWGPIAPLLDGIGTIYFSPDGLLNLVNISALKTPEGPILGDNLNFINVSSTREIIRLKANEESLSATSQIALFGGLDYNMDYSTARQENSPERTISKSNHRVDRSICRGGFRDLPSSLTEVMGIAGAIPKGTVYQAFTEGDGTEEAFKGLSGKGINLIHLATHGFYYSSTELSDVNYIYSNKTTDPLYRCGLILTSGENAWKGGNVPDECEDGILLGEEIAKMDLTDTEIVVLSACNTALGDISPDGVSGLRRAFKRAGVNTLILSLDKVDDKATCVFMTEFYRQLFSGIERHAAFNGAIKFMRESPSFSSPKYWAPFIMLD